MKNLTVASILILLAMASIAPAGVVGVAGGTAAPAPTLGSYTMTPFSADPQPAGYTTVSSVASPLGGTVDFSPSLQHIIVGSDWATWSHGYTGDAYYTAGALSVTLTLPTQTGAFYLYAEPNPFAVHTITATAQDGTSVIQNADGNGGACYYGFYGTDGSWITSITISCSTADFAIGEFGIAAAEAGAPVPVPGAVVLGSIGVGAIGWLRRRKNL